MQESYRKHSRLLCSHRTNAGLEGAVVINKVKESKVGVGFGIQRRYIDMIQAGILDPVKVTSTAERYQRFRNPADHRIRCFNHQRAGSGYAGRRRREWDDVISGIKMSKTK